MGEIGISGGERVGFGVGIWFLCMGFLGAFCNWNENSKIEICL